jgi:transposase
MLEEARDREEIIERVAGLDIGKAEVVVCVRVPSPGSSRRRSQEIATYSTMTRSLARLADRLLELGVTRVVMEATSDYWKPVFYLLEARGLDPWLVNAKDVKHLPGRPKTDKLDAVWLCKLAERADAAPELCAAGTDPPVAGSDPLPDRPGRYPYRGEQRVEKLLEDAQIKLSAVVSDLFGVSGRHMLAALLNGERDPRVLAQLARTRMRLKIPLLEEAFVGHFTDHHAFLLRTLLARVDETSADIAAVEARIGELSTPLAGQVDKLDAIPGIGVTAAHVILAEIGIDMTRTRSGSPPLRICVPGPGSPPG